MNDLRTNEHAVVEALQHFARTAVTCVWFDHLAGALHCEVNFGSGLTHVVFGEISTHGIGGCGNSKERLKAMRALFGGAQTWPPGTAEVRCVSDTFAPAKMMAYTDLVVFVNDTPVSHGLRICTPMRESWK